MSDIITVAIIIACTTAAITLGIYLAVRPNIDKPQKERKVISAKRRRVNIILLSVVSIVLIYYAAMLLNTNSIMKDVRSAFLCKTDISETEGREIDRYNTQHYFEDEERAMGSVDLTLFRLFTLHNFRNGYIWAYYSRTAHDKDGGLVTSSLYHTTKWKIEKINGKWEIVEIFERA